MNRATAMNRPPGHPIPPLLVSLPTYDITFSTPDPHESAFRYASQGCLTIYARLGGGFEDVVLAISFVEDRFPALDRQVYYRCLQAGDIMTVGGDQVDVICQNHCPPNDDLDIEPGPTPVVWNIEFGHDEIAAVRSLLNALAAGRWRHNTAISTLYPADRAALYYTVRAALAEQPIPERLGVLGHWQTPTHTHYSHIPFRYTHFPPANATQPPLTPANNPAELGGGMPPPPMPPVTEMAAAASVLCEMQIVPEQPLPELEGSPAAAGWDTKGEAEEDAGEGPSTRRYSSRGKGKEPEHLLVSPVFFKPEPPSPEAGGY